jgi:hypothetical protein
LEVPAGTPAAWLPSIEDPEFRYQAELLLDARRSVLITGVRHDGDTVMLSGRVVRDVEP